MKLIHHFITPLSLHLIALSLGLLVISCSTDFELEAAWKDIPVAYGFLSKQDTAHYIRVEKAFLQAGGDAEKIAQIADSLYYDDKVQVQLQRVSNGQTFTLQRIDGAADGYPRKEGTFATVPNILYKIRASEIQLKAGETIRLIINRGENTVPVTAETTILSEIEPRESNPFSPVNFGYDRNVSFAWDTDVSAQIFELRLILYYLESAPGNPNNLMPKNLTWTVNDEILREDNGSNRISYTIKGEELYKFLQSSLEPVSDRIRIFDSFDIQITGAGEELVELLQVSRANSGITSSQSIPIYTNLSEGRGIFSSRAYVARTGLTLNSSSQDSLRNGVYTRNLNFQ